MRVGISGLAVSNAGGLGRLARTAICALAASRPDWELHIYLRNKDNIAALHEECGSRYEGVLDQATVHFPPSAWRSRLLLEELDLPRRFAPLQLDAYLGLDFTLPSRRLAQVEAVMVPDLLPFTQPSTVSLRARLLYRRGIKRSTARGARMICISERTRKQLNEIFGGQVVAQPSVAVLDSEEARSQMPSTLNPTQAGTPVPPHPATATSHVIHPALSPRLLDLADASAVHDRPLLVRGSHGSLSGPVQYLLYVGDFGLRKNVKLLVDVYRNMVEQGKYGGCLVLVGGDGRYAASAQQGLALETVGISSAPRGGPQVCDLGRVSDADLSALYASADLLVNLSSEEGFGYPVLEAIAHGTPAVVTKGSAMQEAAPAGIVCTSLDPGAVASTLTSTLAALPVLRQEVHAIDRGWFNIERMGEQLAQVLEK